MVKEVKKDWYKTKSDLEKDTAEGVLDTVRLATHAFDGLNVSDEELDELCDMTLTDEMQVRPQKK